MNYRFTWMQEWEIWILLDSDGEYTKWNKVWKYRVYDDNATIKEKLYTLDESEYPLTQGILGYTPGRDKEVSKTALCFWNFKIHWSSQKVVDDIKILVIDLLWLDIDEITIN